MPSSHHARHHRRAVPVRWLRWPRLLAAVLLLAVGCGRQDSPPDVASPDPPATPPAPAPISLRYAEAFTVDYANGYKLVTVTRPWRGAETAFRYVLAPPGTALQTAGYVPAAFADAPVIRVPVRRVVTLANPFLPAFAMLGAEDSIVGHARPDWITTPVFRDAVAAGRISDVSAGAGQLDLERLLSLQPDLVLANAVGDGSDVHARLASHAIPVVVVADYMETTPLGRAEWLKFSALFLDADAEAERQFDAIAEAYGDLMTRAGSFSKRPTVLIGAPFKGVWYTPGGQSNVALLLRDANAHYIWADDPSSGSQALDLEVVLAAGKEAHFWLNCGTWTSIAEARAEDPRYTHFAAFAPGRLYNNTRTLAANGANDFYETAQARPDLLLADLVHILHPTALPDHTLRWYEALE